MTRRERHIKIIESWGPYSHTYRFERDRVIGRMGYEDFTEEAIEAMAAGMGGTAPQTPYGGLGASPGGGYGNATIAGLGGGGAMPPTMPQGNDKRRKHESRHQQVLRRVQREP